MINNIKFYFNGTSITISKRIELKRKLINLFDKENKPFLKLNYILCNDDFLLSINKEFLGHDDYTDIITFSLGSPEEPITGEIYISVDRIRENAVKHGVTITNELHRVMFHGALHLCGYKDKTNKDKMAMTAREDYYLTRVD